MEPKRQGGRSARLPFSHRSGLQVDRLDRVAVLLPKKWPIGRVKKGNMDSKVTGTQIVVLDRGLTLDGRGAGSIYGDGDGSGDGYGHGQGDGFGDGSGSDGYGDAYGSGVGDGSNGTGDGSGDGRGDGAGDGTGDGNGFGYGYG